MVAFHILSRTNMIKIKIVPLCCRMLIVNRVARNLKNRTDETLSLKNQQIKLD